MRKGDIYLADLEPTRGSEQAGTRPVLVFQKDILSKFTRTVIVIPFTTNLRRAQLPSGVLVRKGDGGLREDSVALCHQIRVLDRSRLTTRLGSLSPAAMEQIEAVLAFTLDMFAR